MYETMREEKYQEPRKIWSKSVIMILFSINRAMKYTEFKSAGDRLCGLVARVPGYRSRGSGFDSRRYQIF
jgi:hypothetical protein